MIQVERDKLRTFENSSSLPLPGKSKSTDDNSLFFQIKVYATCMLLCSHSFSHCSVLPWSDSPLILYIKVRNGSTFSTTFASFRYNTDIYPKCSSMSSIFIHQSKACIASSHNSMFQAFHKCPVSRLASISIQFQIKCRNQFCVECDCLTSHLKLLIKLQWYHRQMFNKLIIVSTIVAYITLKIAIIMMMIATLYNDSISFPVWGRRREPNDFNTIWHQFRLWSFCVHIIKR